MCGCGCGYTGTLHWQTGWCYGAAALAAGAAARVLEGLGGGQGGGVGNLRMEAKLVWPRSNSGINRGPVVSNDHLKWYRRPCAVQW